MTDRPSRQTVCLRCLVSGRVQGVFFRDSTRRVALKLGLYGFARNLDDGRVEVLACGDEGQFPALKRWLAAGPPKARVESLICEPVDGISLAGFRFEGFRIE